MSQILELILKTLFQDLCSTGKKHAKEEIFHVKNYLVNCSVKNAQI